MIATARGFRFGAVSERVTVIRISGPSALDERTVFHQGLRWMAILKIVFVGIRTQANATTDPARKVAA